MRYIQTHHAIQLHDKIIKTSGGLLGIKNIGLLDSVLVHIQNNDYYPNFEKKLTHLIYGIAMNHAFSDGNKRTALELGSHFINLNYSYILADNFLHHFENIIVHVVNNRISKDFLCELVTAYINGKIRDEDILMKIYHAIQE